MRQTTFSAIFTQSLAKKQWNPACNRVFICNVVTKSVISVDTSVIVNEAAKMTEDTKFGTVIVMENSIYVGIVTNRDFTVKVE